MSPYCVLGGMGRCEREYLRGHIEFAKVDDTAGKGRHVLWLILGRHWIAVVDFYEFSE